MAASGAIEPAASASSGTSVTVAVSRSAGVTPGTDVETFWVRPGSSGGASAILSAATGQSPNGPETATAWRALRFAGLDRDVVAAQVHRGRGDGRSDQPQDGQHDHDRGLQAGAGRVHQSTRESSSTG